MKYLRFKFNKNMKINLINLKKDGLMKMNNFNLKKENN